MQAGDASGPELHDAPAFSAEDMEESDGHFHSAAVPEPGEMFVLHSD